MTPANETVCAYCGPDLECDCDEDGGTGWTAAAVNVSGPGGNMRVLNERCKTCILGGADSIAPGLRPGRLKELVSEASDSYVVCHSTLSNTNPHGAVCRGWYERFGAQSNAIRVMGRIGGIAFVDLDPDDP